MDIEMDSFVPSMQWLISPGKSGHRNTDYDPSEGNTLLEQAGWELPPGALFRRNASGDELRLNLAASDSDIRKTWIEAFTQQMKICGVDVVPDYRPVSEFFGENGILAEHRFDMAAYSGVIQSFPDVSQPLPTLALFNRIELSAANPKLQNFAPDPSELYTWNAAQWSIPGKDSLVIGLSAEPASLFPLENSYVSQLIQGLVFGLDYTQLSYNFQPVTLLEFPTLENGRAILKPVTIIEGDALVDTENNAVTLLSGVHYRDALGNELIYTSGSVQTTQMIVEYRFREDLTWSDGIPVARDDYMLAYRILCDPETSKAEFLSPHVFCNQVESVAFTDNSSYAVTWKPGYSDPAYFLPPITRLPAHQVLSDGRHLSEVPPAEWISLPEVRQAPLGIGPYRIKSWEYGKEIILEANPHFYGDIPAATEIEVRFIPIDAGIGPAALISDGEIDVIGWDSLPNFPDSIDALLVGQADGKISLYPVPSRFYELIDFNLDQVVQP